MTVDEFSPEERKLAALVRELKAPASSMTWGAVQRRSLGREPRRSLWPAVLSVAAAGAMAAAVLAGVRLHPGAGVPGSPHVTPLAHAIACRALPAAQTNATATSRQEALDSALRTAALGGETVLRTEVKLAHRSELPHLNDMGDPPGDPGALVWAVALSVKWPATDCPSGQPGSIETWYSVDGGGHVGTAASRKPWPDGFDRLVDLGEPFPPPGTATGTYPMTFWLHCSTSWFRFANRTWYYDDPTNGWSPKEQVPTRMGSPPEDEGTVTFVSPHELEFRDAIGNTGLFFDAPPAIIGKSYTTHILLGSDSNGQVRFMNFNSYGWSVSGTLPPADRGDAGVQVTIALTGPNEAQLRDPSGVTLHMVRGTLLMCA